MKLDQYIVSAGFTSRRKAIVLIDEKQVKVNGKTANKFTPVKETDLVSVNGVNLNLKANSPVFIAYNKPKGIICTSEKIAGNIIDAIKHPQLIYPIGRLDKDSEGLILLTNQSLLIDQIANPQSNHEKEYLVTLNLPVRTKFLEEISKGIKMGKEETKPCQAILEPGTKRVMRIVLTQGLNRQIRRMCNAYQYQVINLQRVRVMNIVLGKLKPGEWRDLSQDELKSIMSQISKETKEAKSNSMAEEKTQSTKKEYQTEPKIKTVANQKFEPKVLEKEKEAPKRLKKHEIKAKQKAPWKKMQATKNKNTTKNVTTFDSTKKAKPRRKKKDNRIAKSFLKKDDGE